MFYPNWASKILKIKMFPKDLFTIEDTQKF